MQQETPVIKVLEPPVVANLNSEPKKSLIVGITLVIGSIIGIICSIILKKNYQKIFFN